MRLFVIKSTVDNESVVLLCSVNNALIIIEKEKEKGLREIMIATRMSKKSVVKDDATWLGLTTE